ncbi:MULTISPECIES: hypothetical protein [unclassified Psychrobacter]|uniref:hypothetical protein n=1 Tax=unclassified Psychrobacter TaxID=196806 RepID=UPI003F46AFED
MPLSSVITSDKTNSYKDKMSLYKASWYQVSSTQASTVKKFPVGPFFIKRTSISALLLLLSSVSYVHADSMSDLIAQKTAQPNLAVPRAKINTRSTIQRTRTNYSTVNNTSRFNAQPTPNTHTYNQPPQITSRSKSFYRYPKIQRQAPAVLPAFLSGNYDNVDSEYLPLLSSAENQSSTAAREVISTARKMALNERAIIQGGCWDYLNEVFKRAGVTRDTVHKGAYRQGPYANSNEIEIGDWLYYINHGYNGVEHSGLFVGWVDEAAKQALILSYAGENRREPARYRVYDLSNVYQIMRPTI